LERGVEEEKGGKARKKTLLRRKWIVLCGTDKKERGGGKAAFRKCTIGCRQNRGERGKGVPERRSKERGALLVVLSRKKKILKRGTIMKKGRWQGL